MCKAESTSELCPFKSETCTSIISYEKKHNPIEYPINKSARMKSVKSEVDLDTKTFDIIIAPHENLEQLNTPLIKNNNEQISYLKETIAKKSLYRKTTNTAERTCINKPINDDIKNYNDNKTVNNELSKEIINEKGINKEQINIIIDHIKINSEPNCDINMKKIIVFTNNLLDSIRKALIDQLSESWKNMPIIRLKGIGKEHINNIQLLIKGLIKEFIEDYLQNKSKTRNEYEEKLGHPKKLYSAELKLLIDKSENIIGNLKRQNGEMKELIKA